MKPSVNQFQSLRRPGIRGQVISRDYKSITVHDTQKVSVQIRTGQLLPGVWDYGYLITSLKDGTTERTAKLPGEGEGWFRSERDAILFALGHIRTMFNLGSDVMDSIDSKISGMYLESLF